MRKICLLKLVLSPQGKVTVISDILAISGVTGFYGPLTRRESGNRYLLYTMKSRDYLYPHEKCLCVPTTNPPLSLNFIKNLRSRLYSVRTSRETDFRKHSDYDISQPTHSVSLSVPSCSLGLGKYNQFGSVGRHTKRIFRYLNIVVP